MGAYKIGCNDLSLATAGQLHTQGGAGALRKASLDLAALVFAQTPLLLSVNGRGRCLIPSFLSSEDSISLLIAQASNRSATPLSKALCGTSFALEKDAPLNAKDVRRIFEEFSGEYRAITTSPLSRTEMHPWVHKFLRSALCEPKLAANPMHVFPNHNQDVLLELARGCIQVISVDCEKHKISLQQAVSGLPFELAASLKGMLNQLNTERPEEMQNDEGFGTLTRLLGKYDGLVDLRNSMLLTNFKIGNLEELSERLGGDEDLMMLALPDNRENRTMAMAAVKQDGWMLHYVPDALKTGEMAMAAVKQHGWMLRFVPKNLQTEEMAMAAVSQYGWTFKFLTDALKTEEMSMAVVKQYGWVLEHVPDALKTEEMSMAAVKQHGWVLKHVPDALKTEEMSMAAVRQHGTVLKHVPDALKTEEMSMAAVRQHGRVLEFVPENLQTEEMVMAAVKQDGRALEFVSENLQTEEVVMVAVNQDGRALEFVPENLQTEEVVMVSVNQDGRALEFVPENLQTEEVVMVAVNQDGRALEFVPEYLKNVVMASVDRDTRGHRYSLDAMHGRQCCNIM